MYGANTNMNPRNVYTREDLKKKKKEVADLQADIEELQISYYQLREDVTEKMTQNVSMKHAKEQIDINKSKEIKMGIRSKSAQIAKKEVKKKDIIKTLQIIMSNKNEENQSIFSDDLRELMGMHSSIKELYSRANMVIFTIRLNCRKADNITDSVSILADFNNTIEDIVDCAASFWELDSRFYQIIDEKSVTIPKDMKVLDVYGNKGGVHKINFQMINKYTTQFEILNSHLKSAEIEGQGVTIVQGPMSSGKKVFKKDIRITKLNENRLENAPDKFFKKYPKLKDYINIREFDRRNVKRAKVLDKYHQRGPISFYTILTIIIIQLIQLFHFNVSDINSLRASLINLFYISPQKTRLNGAYYFSETTSRTDFKHWIQNMTSNLYNSKDNTVMPNNFFSEKCVFLGPPIILKFDTKEKKGDTPGTFHILYNQNTMQTKTLYDENDKVYPWGKFKTKEQLGLVYILEGFLSNYDYGGYALELGVETMPLENITRKIDRIDEFLDVNTMAANFILGGYILDIDYFFSINLAIEKTPSGGYQPIKKEVEVFRPGLRWNYIFNLIGDIIVYILSIGLALIYIRTLIIKKRKGKLGKFISKINFVLTTIFMMVQIAYVVYNSLSIMHDDGVAMLETKSFQDVRSISYRFRTILRLKAFNTGVAVLTMFVILNYKITQKFSIKILNVAIMKNIQYLILILPIFVGLALVGGFILGPYNQDYTYFSKAIISVMLFTIGRITPGKILKYEAYIGMIFMSLIYVIAVFLSFTVFISFGLQSYYEVMAKTGYYASSWHETSLKDFFKFTLFYLPESYFEVKKDKKGGSFLSKKTYAEEEEESEPLNNRRGIKDMNINFSRPPVRPKLKKSPSGKFNGRFSK